MKAIANYSIVMDWVEYRKGNSYEIKKELLKVENPYWKNFFTEEWKENEVNKASESEIKELKVDIDNLTKEVEDLKKVNEEQVKKENNLVATHKTETDNLTKEVEDLKKVQANVKK